ncbi:hypothetical protein TWF694_009990 [Orbilia ellipsospora]|uniref:HIT-type domain-containing protein n=1 Tax=Orbilia ellipsospora TaxID=2528407 RepID=A0AAV9XCK1_9PEZI
MMQGSIAPSSSSRLCSVCFEADFKYACPVCPARTCSVACSKRHKLRASCDGRRRPSAFKTKSDLQQPHQVAADFDFLDSIQRSLNLATPTTDTTGEHQLHTDKQARERCLAQGVRVLNAPPNSSRAKRNKTSSRQCGPDSESTIVWTVDWVLDDAKNTITIEMDENLRLRDAFQDRVIDSIRHMASSPFTESFSLESAQVPLEEIEFRLQTLDPVNKSATLSPLVSTNTLSQALVNTTILEYPSIWVSLPKVKYDTHTLQLH